MSDQPLLASALKQIEADLAQMPADARAVLVTAVDDKGFTTGFALRKAHGWELSAQVTQRWARQRPDCKLVVAKTWK